MSDRELLENAAKAAKIGVFWWPADITAKELAAWVREHAREIAV